MFHLFLIGGIWWLLDDLHSEPTQIEPQAMVLDLSLFTETNKPAEQIQPTEETVEPKEVKSAEKPIKQIQPDKPEFKDKYSEKEETIKHTISPNPHPDSVLSSNNILHNDLSPLRPTQKPNSPTTVAKEEVEFTQKKKIEQTIIKHKIRQKRIRTKRTIAHKKKSFKPRTRRPKRSTQNKQRSSGSIRKRYIRKNYGRIMSISQRALLRLGIPRVKSKRKRVRTTASFRLHPNGSISGLHLSRRSGIRAIDRRTLQVIRRAHRRYPRPKTTVKISITMHYRL